MQTNLIFEKDEKFIFLQDDIYYSGKHGEWNCYLILTTCRIIFIENSYKKSDKNYYFIHFSEVVSNGDTLGIKIVDNAKTPFNYDILKINHKNGKENFYIYQTRNIRSIIKPCIQAYKQYLEKTATDNQ